MLALFLAATLFAGTPPGPTCSILVYHRFGATVADSMTTRTTVFVRQMQALRAAGYRIVPLSKLLAVVRRQDSTAQSLVAITIDDGHHSVFTQLFPLVPSLELPLTLFIYPSAIGHAAYALSWEQLRAMAASPEVVIGAHTYWHPDFRQERQRLAPAAYAQLVATQLARPRTVLRQQLRTEVPFLAWPYGIYDEDLLRQARDSGYTAAFALGNRNASSADPLFALPRHLVVDAVGVQGLLRRLATSPGCVP